MIFPLGDDQVIPLGETVELLAELADRQELVIRHQGRYYNVQQ
jgi:hypothetical protein